MKSRFLLPHQLKLVGWILFIAGIIFMFFAFLVNAEPELFNVKTFAIAAITFDLGNTPHNTYFTFIENNLMDEMVELLLIIGGLLVAFSKNKEEDEFISKLRLESLLWATYINYSILIFSILFIYNISFFYVLVANMFTILLLFIIRFNWVLFKSAKFDKDEK